MQIFLFLGSRRGYAVLKKLVSIQANLCGIFCLVEDPHEEQYHCKISTIAAENNIPIFYSNDIKPNEYHHILSQVKPDIAFAIGWRYLITEETYRIPSKGTLILHDSLLPAYRGFAPMNWAIINGETKTGVTLFYIAEGIDSGPIVDQLVTEINLEDTAKTVDEKIIKLYEKIIIDNLPVLANGSAKCISQNEKNATYTCKRTPEDGEINWQLPAKKIYDLIRGLTHPFPGAYTQLHRRKIFLWESELLSNAEKYIGNIPGRVLGKRNGVILVLTGEGMIGLKKLQFQGEDEKSAADFSVSVKDTFGR